MLVRPQRVTLRLALADAEQAVPDVLARVTARGGRLVGLTRDPERYERADGEVHGLEVELAGDASVDALAADLEDLPGVTVLALVSTPGVARVARTIADDPTAATRFTTRGDIVAVVTDGSAVLGLGDVGPLASLPVMQGKAMLLREFGDVDAIPLLVDEREPAASSAS